MNTDRIKQIQQETAYPESVSVQQALLKVWNETEQEQLRQPPVSSSVILTELTEKLKGRRKWTAENYNPQAANGAITVIDELEAWIRKRS